jgi:micrococcal nuclease
MSPKLETLLKGEAKNLLRKKFGLSTGTAGWVVSIVLILFGLLFATDNLPLPSKVQAPLTEGMYPVVRVVDGDTIIIGDSADKSRQYQIRLIGADTPETVIPNTPVEPFGPEASQFTKQKIAEVNNQVRIAFDGDQTDRYNRVLAMVYLPMPDGDVWLNELLIREGLAKAQMQYRFSNGAKDAFRRAEAEAKAAKRNIWSLPL